MSGDSNTEKDSNECDADRIYNCCPDSDMSEGWWSETSEPSLCPSIRSCVLNTFSAVNIKSDTRSSAISVIADRTACSILTLFIVIATSQPLNKKIHLLTVCRSNNYWGSASASGCIRSPHTSAALSDHWPVVYGTCWACHCWQTSRAYSTRMPESIRHLWHFSLRFLWCILWLNDTSYSKSVWRDK